MLKIIVKSAKYLKSENDLYYSLRASIRKQVTYTKNIEVKIEIETYLDVSNFEKLIIDMLVKLEVIKDDRYIIKLIVVKHPIKRGQSENIKITVTGDIDENK